MLVPEVAAVWGRSRERGPSRRRGVLSSLSTRLFRERERSEERCVGEGGFEDSADSRLGFAEVMARPLHVFFRLTGEGEEDIGQEEGLMASSCSMRR